MGEPIPEDIEGRPLLEAVAPEVKEKRPPEACEPWPDPLPETPGGYTEAEQAAVEERLRDLGYL
jgi:hypothetical protein